MAAASGGGQRGRAAKRSTRRLLLALFGVPLMLSVAYGARYDLIAEAAGVRSVQAQVAIPQPDLTAVTDPVQRGVWLNGIQAVRVALADPNFAGFQQSYVRQSAGDIVSLCGTIPGGDLNGMRFVSVAGDSSQTVVEGRDPSFDTLWSRLCARGDTV